MAKYWVLAVVGAVLLAASIAAFVAESLPRYLTVSEHKVDVVVDMGHVYHKSVSAKARDKFVFDLVVNGGRLNALGLSLGGSYIYGVGDIDAIESEFQAPSDGVYDFTMNSPESVTVNGTVSVQRLTTATTATTLYLGLSLTILSFLFIVYGVYLYIQTKKGQVIECPSCKRSVPINQSKCSYCGFERGVFTLCKHCGTVYQRNLQKCPNCGAPNR